MGTNWIKHWILSFRSMIVEIARYTFLITSLFVAAVANSPVDIEQQNAPQDKQLTILFAGDIMQHGPQIAAALNDSTGIYDYTSCFQYVAPIISSKDLAIANLEVTLAGEPYSGYPQFSAPDELAVGAKNAGFDVLATANNHSCDRGDKGVLRTVRAIDSIGLMRTGTFKDSIDYRKNHPLIFTRNDITVALLNYTYGTNGLPFNYPAMVNLIDESKIINDLTYTKTLNPDFIIVFFHWGNEYQLNPSEQQLGLASLTMEHGADAVIGSHPHVLQPFEYHINGDSLQRNHLVVYSLGNFVSNQRDRYKDGGAMVSFTLLKTWNRKTIIDPEYHLTWVYTPNENNKRQYYIVPVNMPFNDTITDHPFKDTDIGKLQKMDRENVIKMTTFINDSRTNLSNRSNAIPEATYIIPSDL